jgi:hypothetical protein
MRTEELIAALAADNAPKRRPLGQGLLVASLAAALVSLAGFLVVLGLRPDIAEALMTWRFEIKLAIAALTAFVAVSECLRLMRPTAKPSVLPVLAVAAALALAVVIELAASPAETWLTKQVGTNALICLTAIPAMAAAPLAAMIFAMRRGAPTRPGAAGAMAGLASAGIAATLYATHCIDDSPLFVATWYTLAALMVAAIGALSGRLLLRW